MAIALGEKFAVDDFTAHLLILLGYEVSNCFILQRKGVLLLRGENTD